MLDKYVHSLYFSMTTMTTCGYGDFHPSESVERVAAMGAMIVSSGLFGYIIQNISRIVSQFNILAAQYKEKINYVEVFLREKKIP